MKNYVITLLFVLLSYEALAKRQGAQATWHAEYSGTTAVNREIALKNTFCIDYFAGPGHPGEEAQRIAYPILESMGIHQSASILMGDFPCGSCVRIVSAATGAVEHVTIIDQGGAGGFDVHPEIHLILFGRDDTAVPYPFFPPETTERYRGLYGPMPINAERVDFYQCQGNPGPRHVYNNTLQIEGMEAQELVMTSDSEDTFVVSVSEEEVKRLIRINTQ